MNVTPGLKTLAFRGRRWFYAAAAGLVLYALLGFLALPPILRAVLPDRLGTLLGRPITLERVRTNPFTFAITFDGFRVLAPDGEALLEWQRLHVNADLWPLLNRRWEFRTIDLEQPRLRVVLDQAGRLNFADVLERVNKEPAAPAGEPTVVAIGHLRVIGAAATFEDHSRAAPFQTTLGPIGFELDRFHTERDTRSPYAFRGSTESGERFAWSGTLGTDPLRSAGTFELGDLQLSKYAPYYAPQVNFELRDGRATLKASYDFEWSPGRHVLRLDKGSLDLAELAIHEQGSQEPTIHLPTVRATGIEGDLLGNRLGVATVAINGGRLRAHRSPDTGLNLSSLFAASGPPSPAKEPFQLTVQEWALGDCTVQVDDRVPARPVQLRLSHLDASLKDFSLEPGHSSPLELSFQIGDKAKLHAKGTLAPLKPAGELELRLEGLELPPLDAYLDPVADLRFSRGRLALNGRLRFSLEGRKDDGFGYRGDLRISEFEARDGRQNEPFLRWKLLRLTGLDASSQRPAVALKAVDWTEPEARLVMAQNGVSNVARALRLETQGPVASAVPPAPGAEPLIRIARMRIRGGRLSFIDRSLEPNAALLLSEMDGVYTGLSTEAEEATEVDFRGKAGGLAPVTIQGKAMPLRHDRDTDVTIRILGADLTEFSPYTGKYLGYTTRQGKLDVDARIRIQDRRLNIEDKVRLDRMYLGDKVDSPDATNLPVRLGLAILRDRQGVIELEVPVDGSLDDPDIHYGRMVWKAVLNVLGKVITSPFALLSNLFGSGEDLSAIVFTPGADLVTPVEQKKLETLAKALTERPELRLELEGTTDAADTLALKQRGLEARLQVLKWTARKVKIPPNPEEEVIEAAEREGWMRAAFEQSFPPAKDAKIEPPPMAEMEQRLLDTVELDPGELAALAKARNKAAIELLLGNGQVEASRVFEVQGSDSAQAGGARVYFSLK